MALIEAFPRVTCRHSLPTSRKQNSNRQSLNRSHLICRLPIVDNKIIGCILKQLLLLLLEFFYSKISYFLGAQLHLKDVFEVWKFIKLKMQSAFSDQAIPLPGHMQEKTALQEDARNLRSVVRTLCFHYRERRFDLGQGTKILQASWHGQKEIDRENVTTKKIHSLVCS